MSHMKFQESELFLFLKYDSFLQQCLMVLIRKLVLIDQRERIAPLKEMIPVTDIYS